MPASAATRASLRCFSSRSMRQTMTLNEPAIPIDNNVTITRVVSMILALCLLPTAYCLLLTANRQLPQLELHGNFDDDIDRRPVTARRREAPLSHRLHCALVEPGAQPVQQPHVADRAVALHDDLELDVPFDAALAAFFRVIRLHLANDRGRGDAGPWTVGTAASPAAGAWPESRALSLSNAGALPGAGAARRAGAVTVGLLRRRGVGYPRDTGAIARIRGHLHDGRDDFRFLWRRRRFLVHHRRRIDAHGRSTHRDRAAQRGGAFALRGRRGRGFAKAAAPTPPPPPRPDHAH